MLFFLSATEKRLTHFLLLCSVSFWYLGRCHYLNDIAQKGSPAVTKSIVVGADALAQGMVRLDAEIVYSNSRRLSRLLASPKREKRVAAATAAAHVKEILDSLK